MESESLALFFRFSDRSTSAIYDRVSRVSTRFAVHPRRTENRDEQVRRIDDRRNRRPKKSTTFWLGRRNSRARKDDRRVLELGKWVGNSRPTFARCRTDNDRKLKNTRQEKEKRREVEDDAAGICDHRYIVGRSWRPVST